VYSDECKDSFRSIFSVVDWAHRSAKLLARNKWRPKC